MALDGVNGINKSSIEKVELTKEQGSSQRNHILEFEERNYNSYGNEPSDAKIETEMFKEKILSMLDTSKSKRSRENVEYKLNELIKVMQELNGVQKNNLKPNGTKQQNEVYEGRIQERQWLMKEYVADFEGGLSLVQDSKTGLYKLCIGNKQYDIPEREVKIVTVNVEAIHPGDLSEELIPEIVD